MGTPPPPPGWYPDPWRVAPTRWWDGYRWTDHTTLPGASGFPQSQPGGTGGFAQPGGVGLYQPALLRSLHQRESDLWKWARFAVYAWAIVAVVEAALAIPIAHAFRNDIHTLIHDIESHQTTTSMNFGTSRYGPAGVIDTVQLLNLVFAIGFLMWQYKAASVARGLGYRASLSPGLGIAMWFIPIANLVMPLIAMQDLLPRTHPLRSRAVVAWVCYVAAGIVNLSTIVVGYFSLVAAVIPVLVTLGCVATAWRLGLQLLDAVRDDHAQAMAAVRG
jgi:hypothetical protein